MSIYSDGDIGNVSDNEYKTSKAGTKRRTTMKLIDADAVIERAAKISLERGIPEGHEILLMIKTAPEVTGVDGRLRGKWEYLPWGFVCPCCEARFGYDGGGSKWTWWEYCPSCGADMKGEKNEQTD